MLEKHRFSNGFELALWKSLLAFTGVALSARLSGHWARSVTYEAVSVKGERKSESKTKENGITRSEFRYGSFRRVIPLPRKIQNDKVQAEYKDGILNLTLPKTEVEKNQVVKVNLEQAAA